METLENQIRSLIIESLNLEGMSPEEIADDTPLFGEEGLGLDSIDALELGMAVKKRFGVNLSGTTEENRSRFASVKTLADYIRTQKPEEVTETLAHLFEADPESIKPEARLAEDLELDSIDAIDLIVHMQKKTGERFRPEDFQHVKTVQDVVDTLVRLTSDDKAA